MRAATATTTGRKRVERQLCEIFEREVAVFLVPTGTAANALALAQVSPPWGVVFCHAESHIATDECGAPEFFGHGLKLVGLPGDGAKIAPDTLKTALAGYGGHSPHQMVPAALSITQASEAGTIYRTGEIAALAEIAHARALAVHMDGARFANALVRLNASPAEMTWRSGVDVLSLGATKGGALAAEAVIIFDPARAAFMGERRKRAGHLLSKHRFIAAQFLAYLAEDRWLTLARHANAMADKLAEKLTAVGLKPVWPVEANLIFRGAAARARRQAASRRRHLLCAIEREPRRRHRTMSWCVWSRRLRPKSPISNGSSISAKNPDCAQAPPQLQLNSDAGMWFRSHLTGEGRHSCV